MISEPRWKKWQEQNPGRHKQISRQCYLRHRERRLAEQKRYRQVNKVAVARSHKNSRLKRTYGITLDDYERLLHKQGGVCAICRNLPKKYPLSIDHCHTTKRVRGLLCVRCNRGVGIFFDSVALFTRAAEYLQCTELTLK